MVFLFLNRGQFFLFSYVLKIIIFQNITALLVGMVFEDTGVMKLFHLVFDSLPKAFLDLEFIIT